MGYGSTGSHKDCERMSCRTFFVFDFMQYKTFMLPASGSEQTEENLNVFLRTR